MDELQSVKKESVDIALNTLKEGRFMLVRKRRVRIWRSWLVVGIFIGIIAAIIWIAMRTTGMD